MKKTIIQSPQLQLIYTLKHKHNALDFFPPSPFFRLVIPKAWPTERRLKNNRGWITVTHSKARGSDCQE